MTWNFTDISLTFPIKHVGDITVSKIKERFVYEMVGDAANLPHDESGTTVADRDHIRFKGRPESNVTDNYVDTGHIPAEGALNYNVEALWNEGTVNSGINWWARRRFRISAGGGRVRLDKGGVVGHMTQFLTRLQWVY